MSETLWVIMRSTGEYSDRIETPIRYCRTEEEAQLAVDLTSVEAQRDAHLKPEYPPYVSPFVDRPGGLGPCVYRQDKDEIEARRVAAVAEYYAKVEAMGHVDPEGSWSGDSYYYASVTGWGAGV